MKPTSGRRKTKQQCENCNNVNLYEESDDDFPTLNESFDQSNQQTDHQESACASSPVHTASLTTPAKNFDWAQLLHKLNSNQIKDFQPETVACHSNNFRSQPIILEQEDDDVRTYKKKRIKRPNVILKSNATQTNFDDEISGSYPTITIDKEGNISNIPPNVITDGFGLIGLQSMLERRKRNPGLTYLQFGMDLFKLDVDLMSDSPIYPTFGGALNPIIQPKLKVSSNSSRRQNDEMTEEMLFYFYYSSLSNIKQIEAAVELFDRNWRYHQMSNTWMQMNQNENYEHDGPRIAGIYKVFDKEHWGCFLKYSVINVNDLLERSQNNY